MVGLKVGLPGQLLHDLQMQGLLLNRFDELVELYCVIARQVSRDEIVHIALMVFHE